MSDSIGAEDVEVLGPAPKRHTFAEISKKLKHTPQEVWLKLLKAHYGHVAMTHTDWLDKIELLGRKIV